MLTEEWACPGLAGLPQSATFFRILPRGQKVAFSLTCLGYGSYIILLVRILAGS